MRRRMRIKLRVVDVLRFFAIINIGVGLAIAEGVYTPSEESPGSAEHDAG